MKEPDEIRRILDVRSQRDFEASHLRGAVNIPFEELSDRIHELPASYVALTVFDVDSSRVQAAAELLRARGRSDLVVHSGTDLLTDDNCEFGPDQGRLWSPHELLVRALETARAEWNGLAGRCALDIACGTGRDAVFMAMNEMKVAAWDVLPDALERCRSLASRNGVVIETDCRDVEREPSIPAGVFDLVTCFNFLHRPLMSAIAAAVRPGGFIVYETFLVEQRRLFGKPASDNHLLKPGELVGYFEGFDILVSEERLASPRRFVASLIGRRRQC